MRTGYAFALGLLLASACKPYAQETETRETTSQEAPEAPYEGLRFLTAPEPESGFTAPASLQIEVLLDRLGFSSGVLDGRMTRFDAQALRGFQEANGLPESGELDQATKDALATWHETAPTRSVIIPPGFAEGPFAPGLPTETSAQGDYGSLAYRNLMEALAERFHTTPDLLVELNGPQAPIAAGAALRVPNIDDVDPTSLGEDSRGWNRTLVTLGVSPEQPQAAKVVVDKSDATLRAYDASGKLIAQFPATMGSEHDPLPIDKWTIKGVSRNPEFHFNPRLFWDVSDKADSKLLQPGPNGPVGVVWIDISKEHYGIHGTGEPAMIGKAESHGCVRLTNWDAARLAQMVKPGTPAVFQD